MTFFEVTVITCMKLFGKKNICFQNDKKTTPSERVRPNLLCKCGNFKQFKKGKKVVWFYCLTWNDPLSSLHIRVWGGRPITDFKNCRLQSSCGFRAFTLCNKSPQVSFFIGLTVDDSLPLPQRVGHSVDIAVDVVGRSGQLLHLRCELIYDLWKMDENKRSQWQYNSKASDLFQMMSFLKRISSLTCGP